MPSCSTSAVSYNFTTVPLVDQQSSGQLELTLIQLRKATKFLVVIRAFNRYGEGALSPPTSVVTLEDGQLYFYFWLILFLALIIGPKLLTCFDCYRDIIELFLFLCRFIEFVAACGPAPSSSPQSLRCSTSSWQSIEVTWQAPPVSEQNGAIQHYRLHYELMAPTVTDETQELASLAGPQVKTVDGIYVTLTGLMAHSAYRIRVEAATRMGTGPLSGPVTCLTDETGDIFIDWLVVQSHNRTQNNLSFDFEMDETVPRAPTDLKAFSSDVSSISLCWSSPSATNGEIIHYTLNIK